MSFLLKELVNGSFVFEGKVGFRYGKLGLVRFFSWLSIFYISMNFEF